MNKQELQLVHVQRHDDALLAVRAPLNGSDTSSCQSDTRRTSMKTLRSQVTAYYQLQSRTSEDTMAAIADLGRIVELMSEEGLKSLEMSLCLLEQGRLYAVLGDEDSRRRKMRSAAQIRLLCLGVEHPSSQSILAQAYL